jgi:hypothetical protein
MVDETTLEQGSGTCFTLGLCFDSFDRSVLSPEIDRFDITVVALLGVSIVVDGGGTPSSGMYVGCDDDADDDVGWCCCKADAAADRWSREFWCREY